MMENGKNRMIFNLVINYKFYDTPPFKENSDFLSFFKWHMHIILEIVLLSQILAWYTDSR